MVKLLKNTYCGELITDTDVINTNPKDITNINLFLIDGEFRSKIWNYQFGYYAGYHLINYGTYCAYDLAQYHIMLDNRIIDKFYKIFIYGTNYTTKHNSDIATIYLFRFMDKSKSIINAFPLFPIDNDESVKSLKKLSYYKIKKYSLANLINSSIKYFDIIGLCKTKILCAFVPEINEPNSNPKINKLLKKYRYMLANPNYSYVCSKNKILIKSAIKKIEMN